MKTKKIRIFLYQYIYTTTTTKTKMLRIIGIFNNLLEINVVVYQCSLSPRPLAHLFQITTIIPPFPPNYIPTFNNPRNTYTHSHTQTNKRTQTHALHYITNTLTYGTVCNHRLEKMK